MRFFRTTTIFFCISLLIVSSLKAQPVNSKDYPKLKSLYNINKGTRDTCRIAVFVSSIYNCPYCPPGVDCKPCIGDHLMVADSVGGKKQFRVFVKKTANYSIGNKFTLLVRLLKYNSSPEVYEGRVIEQE